MPLWSEWMRCVRQLATACHRRRTGLWLMAVLLAWAARPDLLGVTSLVRSLFLQPAAYHSLLGFFHSSALPLDSLLAAWVRLVLRLFSPLTEGGYFVFVADGLKVAKEGRKMPAVKSLHQESEDNSKAEFIMGHSFQVLSLLVTSVTGQVFAVPLLARICEGLIWHHSGRRPSQLAQLAQLFLKLTRLANVPALLVADAYYANRTVLLPLLEEERQLISRVRSNTVAFKPAPIPKRRGRGRPRIYGAKVKLRNLFHAGQCFEEAPSPVYGESNITIQYRCVDLLWRPVGRLVRFVLVKHPTRGRMILLATDLRLAPLAVIRIYGLRFKIEVSFRQALHTLGGYAYHFWMRHMKPLRRGAGDQHLERRDARYQRAVARKLDAYHRYVQLACIVQGLLQHLAINFTAEVWSNFRSWLRTMNTNLVPSESVTAHALRSSLPEFLLDTSSGRELKKFILDRADCSRLPGFSMAA